MGALLYAEDAIPVARHAVGAACGRTWGSLIILVCIRAAASLPDAGYEVGFWCFGGVDVDLIEIFIFCVKM